MIALLLLGLDGKWHHPDPLPDAKCRSRCGSPTGSLDCPEAEVVPSHHPAIRVRNPGRNYQPGGLQENYLTLRDAMVISIEKYQQNA